ncbi:segregation/condensation protein A [Streptococcus sciuri]|uniref:Segregation and condensation protein A n=1 Tax=Streptococcus sciuri TaxID=2973939 RepID=A0ABT2F9E0_9STRE|nr:segregation/condensation protein A [Streptococcus sciuri]MCS4488833.1 segregation/condensation protein A [Streptococcus sciuri]
MDIKLKDFEGPLDLLLHLVSKYEVDIYDVPIVEIIEQYLAYIATLKAMRLEIASEYMVMASQLMVIKSQKLLPTMVVSLPDEEDLEQELLSQIEEYRQFKELSEELAKQHNKRAQFYSKPKQELIFEETTLAHDKTIMDLFLTFSKIMTNHQETLLQQHTVVERDDYRIEDMMEYLLERMESHKKLCLQEVFEECHQKNEMLTLFLATLELIKLQRVDVRQLEHFGKIYLSLSKENKTEKGQGR